MPRLRFHDIRQRIIVRIVRLERKIVRRVALDINRSRKRHRGIVYRRNDDSDRGRRAARFPVVDVIMKTVLSIIIARWRIEHLATLRSRDAPMERL
ncbi:MAG: hypothetical protein BWY96_03075 [Spirochaetes bacterium ADurb.BinA120]|nr:MAG: hypothetical protein BWY96_03075 [Spirochaetes bacterium ADurb.BinA120]